MSVEAAVINLLVTGNKPFSLQNLCDLLAHQGYKKAAITKAVESAAEAGKIVQKVRG